MASTRAEALSRYARANRVRDITHVPRHRAEDHFGHDASSLDELGMAATAVMTVLQARMVLVMRVLVLMGAAVSMTPVLPLFFS